MTIRLLLILVVTLSTAITTASGDHPLTRFIPAVQPPKKYPRIVLYSVAWCPHCKEAKEYLALHKSPFINKDVETDEQYMKELTDTYKSTGVPLIVIGVDRKIPKGFKKEEVEKALKEAGGP